MTVPAVESVAEFVVLLDQDGQPYGTARKDQVHTHDTPLHLAFSCWVVDDAGRTLLTRRALSKRTWPGAWTNTFCGHPAPGEPPAAAVHRRAADELGCQVSEPVLKLPTFRYRAVMADGTVENELCPVFVAELRSSPALCADEVAEMTWVELAALPQLAASDPDRYSPWFHAQLPQLLPLLAAR